jgi:uncharacterized protein YndB with AHSA1/START domain
MAQLEHEITIAAGASQVWTALTTEDGLRAWQTPGARQQGDAWTFGYRDHPAFTWQVNDQHEPEQLAWTCTDGPGTAPGTTAVFRLRSLPDGRTRVEVVHGGWPDDAAAAAKCNTLWGVLLHALKRHVETGAATPAFD